VKSKINLIHFFIISFTACIVDQISKKYLVKILLENGGNIDIFRFFSLTYVKNSGILFGFFSFDKIKIFLILFSLLAIFLIPLYFFKTKRSEKFLQISLGLMEGGILGNLIDRIKNGYVIDFINFHFWPVFNFADSFITIGIVLFFLKQLKG